MNLPPAELPSISLPPVVLILGPTASGKSELAHRLCEALGPDKAGIVNLDILQVYRGLEIGTGKPDIVERERYHYLNIDLAEPLERMDTEIFVRSAWDQVHSLAAAGKRAFVVGGSGLPSRAFLSGLDVLPAADDALRTRLRGIAAERGWPWLHARLACIDPKRASEIHGNDRTRIERALELFILTGEAPSALYARNSIRKAAMPQPATSHAQVKVVRFEPDPAWLKGRISSRVSRMLGAGWIAEVVALADRYGFAALVEAQSMRAIGYREILDAVHAGGSAAEGGGLGTIDPAELADFISTRTWQYARRQLNWNAGERVDLLLRPEDAMALDAALPAILAWI